MEISKEEFVERLRSLVPPSDSSEAYDFLIKQRNMVLLDREQWEALKALITKFPCLSCNDLKEYDCLDYHTCFRDWLEKVKELMGE